MDNITIENKEIDLGAITNTARLNLERKSKKYLEKTEGIKLRISRRKKEGTGVPDCFYITEQGEKIYVEFKSQCDGLRESQLRWILKNKDKKVRIIWFFYIYADKKYCLH